MFILQQLFDIIAFLHTERSLPSILHRQSGCFVLRNLRTDHISIDHHGRVQLTHFKHVLMCSSSAPPGQLLKPIRMSTGQTLRADSEVDLRTLLTTEALSVTSLEYCAPELLRSEPFPIGAIDCRLRQIDMYALGICVWELCMRCHHLYEDETPSTIPSYSCPLNHELKCAQMRKTRSQMQLLIDSHQTRPLFPDTWKRLDPFVG